MSVIITELLGTDSFSGSRLSINANFNSIKSEVDAIESVFGLSLASGNLDVSAATGGQIKGKTAVFNTMQLPASGAPTITLNGTTGAAAAVSLTVSSAITATTLSINLGGSVTNQGSLDQQGEADFSDLVKIQAGVAKSYLDIGATNTHTVLNSDTILIFDGTGGTADLTLTPDASLVDGHVVTIIKKGAGACALVTSNIVGYTSGSIDFDTATLKSSITLLYSTTNAGWIVVSQNKMTLV